MEYKIKSPTITANGPTTFCKGNSVTLTSSPATSYLWSNNGTTQSITVSTSGNYSVTTNDGSECLENSSVITVLVNELPANAGIITGIATVSQGQNSVIYTVPTIANTTSYIWTLPSGATGTSTTSSITVNYGTSAVSGNITVKGNNPCGDGGSSSLPIVVNVKPSTPVIEISKTSLSFGSVTVNTTSTAQSFTVSGSNLTTSISLSAPAGFEISKTSGSGFGTSLSLTQTGGTVTSTTIYVHFSPTSAGAKSGEISVSSSGATVKKVAVSGTGEAVIVPSITVSATSLSDFGSVAVNTTSTAQSFTVSGSNLTANISITALAGFEISKSSGSGYAELA